MIRKILNLLTNTKFVIALIVLSALIVIFGIVLILSASTSNPDLPEVVQNVEPADTSFNDSLQTTESLINSNTESAPSPSSDSRQLERGSEAWCEDMLTKANDDWSEADTQLFAQKCI